MLHEIDRLILAVKFSRPVASRDLLKYIMENYDPRYMYERWHSPLGGGGYGSAQGEGVTGEDHTREACHGVSYQGAYPQRALSGVRVAGRCSEGLPAFTRS